LLMAHPAVQEAAVIAVADAKWGERPLACVVTKPGQATTADDGFGSSVTHPYFMLHSHVQCDEYAILPRVHEGKKHGKGQTSSAEAREPCPTMRMVRQPRARRCRHGNLPGQGAGHVPCRVSVPVPRRHVAVGGAVGMTACTPSYDTGYQPCSDI